MAALYVAPEARGQGLAGKLQQHVIDYARKQGYGELFLYSACRDFYERFGWQYIGEGSWIIRPPPSVYTATICRYREAQSPSDGGPA